MRTIFGWTWKLALGGLIYLGVVGGESSVQIKDLAAQTQSGFKKISDSLTGR